MSRPDHVVDQAQYDGAAKVYPGMNNKRTCRCGSGQTPYPLYDGRGIYLTSACTKCERERLSHFRPEILRHYTEEDVIEAIEPE